MTTPLGRQLATMTKNSGEEWEYTYDADGLRTQRTNGVITYKYYYSNGVLKSMNVGTAKLVFDYDANGLPLALTYKVGDGDEMVYCFVTNLQGDVMAIMDGGGNTIVAYTYDAWGRVLTTTGTLATSLGQINPLRYRGYVYDQETGLYYLQSRYYNPEWGRFINADSLIAPENSPGTNTFAYCCNNPIKHKDSTGHWFETVFDLFSLGVSVVDVVINPLDPWAWAGLAGDALDLIPFVTGVGEGVKGMRVVAKGADLADDALTTIRFAKAVDFTDDAIDAIRTLDKVGDFTQSTMTAGRQIHKGYKALQDGKEYAKIPGIRIDFFDGKNIFELKPYNKRALHQGVNQLIRYSNKIDHPVFLILEFY